MRRLTTVVIALSTFLSLLLVVPAQADPVAARWNCGSRCNGTDPAEFQATPTGGVCAADARTVATTPNAEHGLTLQLRYSPTCRTVWGRIYGGRKQNYYIRLWQWLPGPQEYEPKGSPREIGPVGNRPFEWGWQWDDAGVQIRACVSTQWDSIGEFACTARY
ncbi:DUF2690 domain-containing protein [Actinophytocola sp.]|uniref:DUF2690 domain-containing protein n=1 Tax=Actinophytocola sp. TaxID=1872138 RepID=UPI002ED0DF7B